MSFRECSVLKFHNYVLLLDVLALFCYIARMYLFSRMNLSIIGDKQLQKKERGNFTQRSAHQAKKQCKLCGWLERQQGGLHLLT